MTSKSSTLSAFIMLLSGIALSVASFCTPPEGNISDSVMRFMGEALIYAASVFGLTSYVNYKIKDWEQTVQNNKAQKQQTAK